MHNFRRALRPGARIGIGRGNVHNVVPGRRDPTTAVLAEAP